MAEETIPYPMQQQEETAMFMRYPGGLSKALTFSYDDGVEQDRELIRILNEHGMKGTFNLNSGLYAPEGHQWPEGQIHRRMTRQQCIDLYKNSGHEVAVHCLKHESLVELPSSAMTHEVMMDRINLERDYGGMVRGMAYPFGTYSDTAVEVLRSCGIQYARTVITTHSFSIPDDWLRLTTTCHHNDPMLMELADRFLNANVHAGSYLFYLWGHSYEFEADNNWHVIRDFCDKMAGKDDIWYATNGEIFTYVEAWKQLIVSADNRRAYNPTNTTLWFKDDQGTHAIAPGETLEIG